MKNVLADAAQEAIGESVDFAYVDQSTGECAFKPAADRSIALEAVKLRQATRLCVLLARQ